MHQDKNLKSTEKRKEQFSNIRILSTSGSKLDPDLDKPGSPKCRCSDQSTPITSQPQLNFKTLSAIVSQDYGSSNIEYESKGSDRETRGFISDPEPDSEGQPSDPVYLKLRAGIAISKYSFPEENPTFNLYAPFPYYIDYQLVQFLGRSKISSTKIDKFFNDKILKDLNTTYNVQWCTRLYLHAVCTGNFLSSAEDTNRVRRRLSRMFSFGWQT